jgi:hypothetical protein
VIGRLSASPLRRRSPGRTSTGASAASAHGPSVFSNAKAFSLYYSLLAYSYK